MGSVVIKKRPYKRRDPNARNYIDKELLWDALLKYEKERDAARERGEIDPPLSEYIGSCILKIATEYASRPSFFYMSYDDKQDMIADGAFNACRYVQMSFNSSRATTNNAFSFITYCVWSGAMTHFKGNRRFMERKNAYLEALTTGQILLPEIADLNNVNDYLTRLQSMVDQMNADLED